MAVANEGISSKREYSDFIGKEKAAILLITLGPEKSAQVFKHLKEDEIEQITLEIANITTVLPDVKEAVLDEFYQICLAQQYITEGGIQYAKQLLERALGETRAFDIISKMTNSLQVRPFDFVRKAEAGQVLNFIQHEHPQTIALILSYLKGQQAAQVLADLPQEKQADVVRRIAVMNRTTPDVIKEVEKTLEKKLSTLMMEGMTTVGGIDAVVEILGSVDRGTEKNIMETLEAEDYELSDEIRKKMFVFEDILSLGNRDIQLVLRQDIDNKEIATALKGSTEDVQNLVFANMSKRLAAMIKEDMDFMGPVRRSDVEEAQQKIVSIIRRLQDAGEIIVARGGGDDIVV
ncbi:MAG: flagellar motor switch protein FliG [Defluviitaleaceae bacterium]|nr:flagellar motor switch protein FliG [Defluviitaleaceae bacterium]